MNLNIAIFASGSGTNAENIIRYFEKKKLVKVALVLSNNANALVLERAKELNVPTFVFDRKMLDDSNLVVDALREYEIHFVVLSGFLLRVPVSILQAYPNKIVNIHPALLPRHGGKGMYGMRVHQAVVNSKDADTGITIHYINEHYDEGDVIFQASCEVLPTDTPEAVAAKVHELEYRYYPKVIEDLLSKPL